MHGLSRQEHEARASLTVPIVCPFIVAVTTAELHGCEEMLTRMFFTFAPEGNGSVYAQPENH